MSDSTTTRDDVFAARVGLGLRELDGTERAPDVAHLVADELDRDTTPATPGSPRGSRRLVLAAALLGLAVTATLLVERQLGGPTTDPAAQDPQGAWRLVYELPLLAILQDMPAGSDPDTEVASYLDTVRKRVGDDSAVTRLDERTFAVDFTATGDESVARMRALLERGDHLAMRIVASPGYWAEGVRFDLAAETKRLRTWLDGGGRDRVLDDPRALSGYRSGTTAIRWFLHRVRPDERAPGSWRARFTGRPQMKAVPLHSEDDWNQGKVPQRIEALEPTQRQLLELVAINMHEVAFAGEDFDPERTVITNDRERDLGYELDYSVVGARAGLYGEFSEKHIGQACAILVNNEVLSAPIFESRIPGVGRLSGLSRAAANAIAHAMRAPLEATPRLVRSSPRQAK